eukprot:249369-Prorocentrum_minimum.AAC.1
MAIIFMGCWSFNFWWERRFPDRRRPPRPAPTGEGAPLFATLAPFLLPIPTPSQTQKLSRP